jgi:hypothetical protein
VNTTTPYLFGWDKNQIYYARNRIKE